MFLGFCFLYLFAIVFWNFFWKRRKFPPGPAPLPVVGNLLELEKRATDGIGYVAYDSFTKDFGPVYTLWIGEHPYVMITDYELIKDSMLCQGDAFSGRHCFAGSHMLTATHGEIHGISRSTGDEWHFLRRAGLSILRDLGMGKSGFGERLLQELSNMSARIQLEKAQRKTDVHDFGPLIDIWSGSAITLMLWGHPIEKNNEEKYIWLKNETRKMFVKAPWKSTAIWASIGWLRHIPPISNSYKQMDTHMSNIFGHLDSEIAQKLEKRQKGEVLKCEENSFVDTFLDEMEQCAEQSKNEQFTLKKQQYINVESLRNMCFDMFIAGIEAPSNTLQFMCIYLALDQRIQQKLHAELEKFALKEDLIHRALDGVSAKDNAKKLDALCRAITLEHRPHLPYTNAVVNETFRMVNSIPFNFGRLTLDEATVGGHRIEKGTRICAQISSVLYDPKIYPDPDKFMPERFLNANGVLKKADELIPFGLGKRQCIGEGIVRMQLFLFAANFFLAYRVYPENALKPPSVSKTLGVAVAPKDDVRLRVETYSELIK